jgi:MFS family permease
VFLAVLRRGSLRRVLAAFFLFSAAEWAVWIAILVYAFTKGGTTAAGFVALIQLVPAALIAPVGSVMGDRLRRDHALALGYAAQSVTMALVATALWFEAPLAVVYLAAVSSSCAYTLTRPVHYAILPELADTPEELTASNAATSTLEGLAIFVGPLACSALIAPAGPWLVFAVMAGASVLNAAMTVHLSIRHVDVSYRPETSRKVVADAVDGFRELRREPGAATLVALVGAQFVVLGCLDVLFAVMAIDVLGMGQAGAGILASAVGIGGVIGAVGTAVLVGRRRMVPAVGLGILLTGIPLVLVATARIPAWVLLMLAVSGAGKAFFDVSGRTLLQRTVPDDVLARIFGVQEGLAMAGLALGSVAAPVFAAVLGPRGAFVAAGILLPSFGALAWPRLRSLEATAIEPGPRFTTLSNVPIFRPLAQPVLERLSWQVAEVDVPAGTVLIREGERGDRFSLIERGIVSVTMGGAPVATLGPGDYFGEIALLRNVPRTATVAADSDLSLLTLEREQFVAAVTGSRVATRLANLEADRRLGEFNPPTGI